MKSHAPRQSSWLLSALLCLAASTPSLAGNPSVASPPTEDYPWMSIANWHNIHQSFVAKAPVVIVCCGKRYPQKYNWIGDNLYLVDLGIAIEHMALAARNEGLGSCWIGAFEDQPIKKLLGIPADHDVVMMLPIGYPVSEDQFSTTTERLAMDQIVFWERFGTQAEK